MILSFITSLVAGLACPADQLDRSRLPADVDVVVHLDIEGLRRTQLWRYMESSEEFHISVSELDEFRTRFGIDLLNDVRSATVYKTRDEEEPTVAILHMAPSVDEALKRMQGEAGYRSIERSGITLHTWGDPDDEEDAAYASVHPLRGGDRLVVVAANPEDAVRAARVVRGEEESLANVREPALRVQPAPGSFLYVSAVEIPGLGAEFTPASQVFGLAQGIQLDLGEAGGYLQAHVRVVTESPEQAQSVAAVINGVIGLGNLASLELGEASEMVQEVLRSLRVNAVDSEVTLDFQYSVSALLSTIQALEAFEEATESEESETESKEEADEVDEDDDEVRVEKRVEKKHDGRREHRGD